MSNGYGFEDLIIQYSSDTSFILYPPTSVSSGAFTFSSSNELVATISENIVTITGTGSTTLTSFQEAADEYSSVTTTMTLTVTLIDTVLTDFEDIIETYSDDTFILIQPTSNNSNGLFIYTSSNETVAEIYDNVVKMVGIGSVIITATQEASGYYNTASISCNLTVNKIDTILTNVYDTTYLYSNELIIIDEPLSNSSAPFTYHSSNLNVVQILDNTMRLINTGTAVITVTQASNEFYNSATITYTVNVTKINPELSNFAIPEKTYGDSEFDLISPNSNSDGEFIYFSSNENIATIIENTVTIVGAGIVYITATQTETDIFSSSSITSVFFINKFQPILSNFEIPEKIYSDSPFELSYPLSESDGEFTFTSSHYEVATINENIAIVNGAGSSTISVFQAETDNYYSAKITAVLNVSKLTTILSGFSIPEKIFGDNSFELNIPISNSDGAFIYASLDETVARIVGNTVTVVGAGTTTIIATQIETPNYLSNSISTEINVIKANPILGELANINKNYGDEPFNLSSPSSNSPGLFLYYVSNASVVRIIDNTVNVLNAGITTITASQAATANYLAASTTCSLTVNKAATILSNFENVNKTFGDIPFDLIAPTSNSPGVITYSSSNPLVATVSESSVTIVGSGSAIITALQAASSNYQEATISLTLTVNKAATILSSFENVNKTFGDIPFNLITPTSNRPEVITYSSSNLLVATVSGSTVTIIRAGTTVISALQAASSNYLEATISLTLTVNKAATSLSNFVNVNKTFEDIPFDLIAPTSNRPGVFIYSSSNPLVATVSGSTITIIGAGTAVITALQTETNNYLESSISLTLTVNKAAPTLTSFIDFIKYLGDIPFNLTAPISNSNGAFSYISSAPSVATVLDSTVTVVKDGSTTITAYQAATSNYIDASIQLTLTVYNLTPTLNSFDNINKIYGEIFVLTDPISTSSGEFTYSSSNENIATIVGKTVTVVGVGTVIITAVQAATAYYYSSSINCELITIKANPIINNFVLSTKTFKEEPFDLIAPISNSNGLFTYSSTNPLVATVSGSSVTVVGAGSTVITAFQAATANFNSGSINCELIVNKALPELSDFNSQTKMIYDDDFLLYYPSSTSPGSFSYISSNPNVASVSGNLVSINDGGNTTILARQEETNNYESASITCVITILKRPTILSNFRNLEKTFGNNDFSLSDPTSNREGSYRYVSSNPLVAIISNNTVKIVGGGSSIITALQAESAEYAEGTINCVLTVFQINPKLININVTNENDEYQIRYQSTSDGTYSYTFSDNSAVKINSNNTLTFLKKATVIVTIHQHETANYFKGTYSTIIDHNM